VTASTSRDCSKLHLQPASEETSNTRLDIDLFRHRN
jgi:hypothetical protein